MEALEQRVFLSAASFTIDAARSSIAVSASLTAFHLPLNPQSSDGSSLVTSYEGTIAADLSSGSIAFPGGSRVAAQVSGVWQPGDPPGSAADPGSGPADYGGKATVPFEGTELIAARNLVFDLLSQPTAIAPDGTFGSTAQTMTSTQGIVDGAGADPMTVDLAGEQISNQTQTPSSYTVSGNVATLVIPVHLDLLFQTLTPQDSRMTFDGQIVATANVAPPRVTAASFNYLTGPQSLSFTFSTDVSKSLSLASLDVQNPATGQSVQPAALAYDATTNTATFTFPGVISDGRYTATLLAAQVSDASGRPLAGGADFHYDFFFLQGDVNHDGSVNFSDLLALAQNYGRAGTFAQGDLNYDQTVNFADLLTLAQRYGKALPPPQTI